MLQLVHSDELVKEAVEAGVMVQPQSDHLESWVGEAEELLLEVLHAIVLGIVVAVVEQDCDWELEDSLNAGKAAVHQT